MWQWLKAHDIEIYFAIAAAYVIWTLIKVWYKHH